MAAPATHQRPPAKSLAAQARSARIDRCVIDYVHIAIDDATRLAYAEVLSDEKATTAIAFLHRAIAFF
jgi:Integrase core domain